MPRGDAHVGIPHCLLTSGPCLQDPEANRQFIDRAVTTVAADAATWILTPELYLYGYDFCDLDEWPSACGNRSNETLAPEWQ